MAVPTPTAPERTIVERSPAATIILRLRRFVQSLGRPIFAIVLAIIAGGIVIMATTPGSIIDRFNEVIAAYSALFTGAFGNAQNFSFTLVTVTPLILTGLSVAIAFRAGLFNIGAAGQLAMGAMTACIIGLKEPHWPGWLLIPTMILASIAAGAIWGGIVGLLKAWRGAHEVVTTIMLNWIAFYFTDYLIDGPLSAAHSTNQTNALPHQATLPHIADFYNSTLGTFLPKIYQPTQYLVDVGFFISILALVIYWFIMSRTTFGYEVRVVGQNPKAARYAGISIKRNIILVMLLAGAFSGLAGALRLMGQFPYQLIASTFAIDTTGFDAIGVALLGRMSAFGVFLSSLLFGGLRQGGTIMQLNANVPGDLVFIIQALVLFSIASEFLPAIQRSWPKSLRFNRRPSLAPAISGATVVDLPQNSADELENVQNGKNAQDAKSARENAQSGTVKEEE